MAQILIAMMLVVRVVGGTVVVVVKKLKRYNLPLLISADNSLPETCPIGEQTGDSQKPDNYLFRH